MKIEFKSTIRNIAVITGAAVIVSLIFMPFSTWTFFGVGLLCGAGAAIAAFTLTYLFTERAVRAGRSGPAIAGIGLKFVLYLGVMAIMTIAFGFWGGVGAATGCLTGPLAIMSAHVIAPGIKRKISAAKGAGGTDPGSDREYIYEEHIRARDGSLRYVFMRGVYFRSDSGGRNYVTHRRFRKLREIRVKNASEGDRGRRAITHG